MANKKKNSNTNNLKFIINAQFLKTFLLRTLVHLNLLRSFSSNPSFNIDVDVKSKTLTDHGPNIYEVELIVKGETKADDKTLFLIESSYCGIFTIENATDDIMEKILMIECPKFLFPFLRSIIASSTREGGFPPLMLNPVDFVGMYEKKKSSK